MPTVVPYFEASFISSGETQDTKKTVKPERKTIKKTLIKNLSAE